jgi:hypothetical protein
VADLESARAQGDQAQLMTQRVVHALRYAIALTQTGLLERHPLFSLDPFGALPSRRDKTEALLAITTEQPRQHNEDQGCQQQEKPGQDRVGQQRRTT